MDVDELLRDDLVFEYARAYKDEEHIGEKKLQRNMYADLKTIHTQKAIEFAKSNSGCYAAMLSREYEGKAFPRCFSLDMDVENPFNLSSREEYLDRMLDLKTLAVYVNIYLVNMLGLSPDQDFRWHFTGQRGFRLEINIWSFGLDEADFVMEQKEDTYTTPALKAFKKMAEYLKEHILPLANVNLSPNAIDTSIYKWRSLVRVPNSLHELSESYHGKWLYQVALSPQELSSLSIEEILEIAQEPRPFPPFKKTDAKPGLQKLYSIAKKEIPEERERQSNRPVTVIPHPVLNKAIEPINTTGQELLEKYLPDLQRYCPLVAKVVQEGCISHNRSVAVNAVARAFCALRMSQEEAEKLIWLIEPKITDTCGDFKTRKRKDRNNWIIHTVRKSYEKGQPRNRCDYYSRRIFPSLKNTVCPGCGVKKLDSLRGDLTAFIDTALNSPKPDTIYLLGAPPGSGKTTLLHKKVRERNLRPLTVVQRHSQAEEVNKNIYNNKALQLKGRDKLCRDDQKRELISKLAERGYSAEKQVCKSCKNKCGYGKQFKHLGSFPAIFLPQEMFFAENFLLYRRELLNHTNLVIFEESIFNNLVNRRDITRKDIEATLNIVEKENETLRMILAALLELIKRRKEFTGKDLITSLRQKGINDHNAIRELLSRDWNEFIINSLENPQIAKLIKQEKLSVGPSLFLNQFLKILVYEMEHDAPQTRIRIRNNKLVLYTRNTLKDINKPIFIDDASADEKILRKIFGDKKIEKYYPRLVWPSSVKTISNNQCDLRGKTNTA